MPECTDRFVVDGTQHRCVGSTCPDDKPFLVTIGDIKECVAACSAPYKYYVNKDCLVKCPDDKIYSVKG